MDSAADRAASGIRRLIASGEFAPGEQLPGERELSERLGVSRPALREGLGRLHAGGVLESRRGAGTFVVEIDLDGVFEVRTKLEPVAAEYSAMWRADEQAVELRRLVELMRDQIDDREVFVNADARVHALIAESSQLPTLALTLHRLAELASIGRTLTSPNPGLRLSALKDIEYVVAAIESRHSRRAAIAMERHLVRVWDDYVTLSAQAGEGPQAPSPAAGSA